MARSRPPPEGLHVEGVIDGGDARDVNRRLLPALRRVELRTRLRAEWTGGGVAYRFFDYVQGRTTCITGRSSAPVLTRPDSR